MVFAKGIANGMPVSGVVTRKEIMDVMTPGSLVRALSLYVYPRRDSN